MQSPTQFVQLKPTRARVHFQYINMDNAVLAYSLLETEGLMLHCLPHLRFLRI
jgi:hypothetical protein